MGRPGVRLRETGRSLDAYAAFRIRDYRPLLAGNFLSAFGLQMVAVAVSWDLYVRTHSPVVLGNVGFAQVAPFLFFALFAGQLADRMNRRTILVAGQLLNVMVSVILAFAPHSVLLVYACLMLTATARAFQWPARGAIFSQIVPHSLMSNAVTWNSSAMEVANMAGPAAAGFVVALAGSRAVYLIQIALAVLTFACFLSLPGNLAPPARPAGAAKQSLLEGLRFVHGNKLILSAVSLDLFAVLFGGAVALLPVFAADILGAGPQALGWLRAAPSAGAVLAAVLQAHSRRIEHAGRALLATVAAFGLATIGFAFSRNLWLSLLALALIGAFDNVSVVLRQSLLQTRTPDNVRGRVFAVSSIFINCSNQLGAVESGWAAALFGGGGPGAVASVWTGGAATLLVVAACAGLSPSLRNWKSGDSPHPAA